MASSSKRLQNDMSNYETLSDHKIASRMYYIVRIHLESNSDCPGLIKKLLRRNFESDGLPLVGYTYENDIYLLFSSLEDSGLTPGTGGQKNEHFMSGSHQRICSYFSSKISRSKNMDVACSIVEFDSRTKIIVYFQTKIYENLKKTIDNALNGSITKKELDTLSMFELLELLKKNSLDWSSVQPIVKFGMFYKYIEDEDRKGKFSTLSELFNIKDFDKYIKYLFN